MYLNIHIVDASNTSDSYYCLPPPLQFRPQQPYFMPVLKTRDIKKKDFKMRVSHLGMVVKFQNQKLITEQKFMKKQMSQLHTAL
jgi:hypothetical protein